MRRDIRESSNYREAEALYGTFHSTATGRMVDAAQLAVSPDGREAVCVGTWAEMPGCVEATHICRVDLDTGEMRVITSGPSKNRFPRYSPEGRRIAFLSDRHRAGDFQLYLFDLVTGVERAASPVEGWVEYLHWSPDGTQVLLGVAGHGADLPSGQGAITTQDGRSGTPSWCPTIDVGEEDSHWRRAWIYDLTTERAWCASPPQCNVWEATWLDVRSIVAITSAIPGEGHWYSARLDIIDIDINIGKRSELFTPTEQLGRLKCSPSGQYIGVIEALCSDREVIAGDLRLIDRLTGRVRQIDSCGTDISYFEWLGNERLLIAGHRGFETVVCLCDLSLGSTSEVWSSHDVSTNGFHVRVSGIGRHGDCALLSETFTRPPELAVIRRGVYHTVCRLTSESDQSATLVNSIRPVCWKAFDGLEIQGWVLLPKASLPVPLVMCVHGGPVWHWHPTWLGRKNLFALLLLKKGYGIFLPNPRGSSARGQDFARRVCGDMGGTDTGDYLSGLDFLVAQGIADPDRLGVTGTSYGGYMTCWLITHDARFAAAVPVSPATNRISQYLTCNIPQFVSKFLGEGFTQSGGKYLERSPVMYAHQAKTPTLSICGALDRCTPPTEAAQFHGALLQHGIESVLVTYPEEGHGIRGIPAVIDQAARMVSWFEKHMAGSERG